MPSQFRMMSHMRMVVLFVFVVMSSSLAVNMAYSANGANTSVTIKVSRPKTTDSKKLSFYFQSIDIRALLQLIAKNSGLNFVISDTVKGNITLSLKNVTWQQALDIILKSQGLASRKDGNVVYISTLEAITGNEAKQLESDDQLANLAPVSSTIINLKYTNAGDLATLLKGAQSSLLTSRGQVAVDTRTNSVIVRDTKKSLADVIRAVKRLDVPAKQVLIEAHIVSIDTTYEQTLGVRFGSSTRNHVSGTFQGANQVTGGTTPSQVANSSGTVDPTQRLNFNNPAKALFDGSPPGSIAMALARVGPVLLDLELSALEGENHAKIVAKPRVITSNGQKAMIQTGEEIPYQEASSSGATSVTFKKAVLSLEITPQITPDNKIILVLKATQDSRGINTQVGTGSTGTPVDIPAINTQEVQSNILLNNNETIVIGGVYKQTKQNSWDRIPFFGSLPVVGYLFGYRSWHDEKHELLVFITPKIITSNTGAKMEG